MAKKHLGQIVSYAVAASVGMFSQATAEEGSIAANDLIVLRVMDWDPVTEAVTEWPAISGEFRVRSDGTLDLPFIEPFVADGRSAVDVAAKIAMALRDRFALSEAPEATISIENYRPVLVSGLVRTPGEVEFTPGMTVRHAIALAGGPEQSLQRGSDAFREMIGTEGSLHLLGLERMRQMIKLARLEAERFVLDDIGMPEGLSGPMAERILAEQGEIMKRRSDRIESERMALSDRRTLLENEIQSLQQQLAGYERQQALAEEARDNVQALAIDRLVVNNRILDSERTLVLIENQVLDASTAILRARLDVTATERELAEIISSRDTQVVEEMISTEAELADTEQRIETTVQQLNVDEIRVAEMLEAGPAAIGIVEPSYRIFRMDGTQLEAGPESLLQSGDLVEMIITPSGWSPLTALGAN